MLALPLLALLLAAPPPPDQPRAEALLASPRPIDKAWGAYLAGRLNLTALTPKLAAELDRLRPIPTTLDRENWSLAHTLLDTLIELKAPLSFEQLKPWLEDYGNEALILLLQNAGNNQRELLELRPALRRQDHWLAATNILVQQRAPGIALALLSELRPESTFVAADSPGHSGVGAGIGGGFSGCGSTAFAKDFPPAARYLIVTFPTPGDILLAPGPKNAFLRRTVLPTNQQIGYSESGSQYDTQSELISYLASLAYASVDQLRPGILANRSIVWSTPEEFRQEAELALQLQAGTIRGLINQFVSKDLLSSADRSSLQLSITPRYLDLRKSQSEPLPSLDPYPVDLTNP
jgi:hypothetical protein